VEASLKESNGYCMLVGTEDDGLDTVYNLVLITGLEAGLPFLLHIHMCICTLCAVYYVLSIEFAKNIDNALPRMTALS
jgi:hypothetical protein